MQKTRKNKRKKQEKNNRKLIPGNWGPLTRKHKGRRTSLKTVVGWSFPPSFVPHTVHGYPTFGDPQTRLVQVTPSLRFVAFSLCFRLYRKTLQTWRHVPEEPSVPGNEFALLFLICACFLVFALVFLIYTCFCACFAKTMVFTIMSQNVQVIELNLLKSDNGENKSQFTTI